jgi:two-component system LytT family response regulator/two-component system response regulator LytT
MKPLRVIIAEDEDLMRHHLRSLLSQIDPPIELIAEATDGGEAVALCEQHKPDLLLLDIQMPVYDGFAVVEKLMLGGTVPEIIFTTAYDRYALRAFELNATHYLLKPVSLERLKAAVQRASERVAGRVATVINEVQPPEEGESLQALVKSHRETQPARAPRPRLSGLTSKVRDQIVVIPLDEIFHISSEGGLNFIHSARGKFLTDFTLDELEQRLEPDQFLRIYRGHIVALKHVRALVPWTDGKFEVILDDEAKTHLSLSRYRLAEMRARLLW